VEDFIYFFVSHSYIFLHFFVIHVGRVTLCTFVHEREQEFRDVFSACCFCNLTIVELFKLRRTSRLFQAVVKNTKCYEVLLDLDISDRMQKSWGEILYDVGKICANIMNAMRIQEFCMSSRNYSIDTLNSWYRDSIERITIQNLWIGISEEMVRTLSGMYKRFSRITCLNLRPYTISYGFMSILLSGKIQIESLILHNFHFDGTENDFYVYWDQVDTTKVGLKKLEIIDPHLPHYGMYEEHKNFFQKLQVQKLVLCLNGKECDEFYNAICENKTISEMEIQLCVQHQNRFHTLGPFLARMIMDESCCNRTLNIMFSGIWFMKDLINVLKVWNKKGCVTIRKYQFHFACVVNVSIVDVRDLFTAALEKAERKEVQKNTIIFLEMDLGDGNTRYNPQILSRADYKKMYDVYEGMRQKFHPSIEFRFQFSFLGLRRNVVGRRERILQIDWEKDAWSIDIPWGKKK